MQPILLETGQHVVLSYPVMLFLAVASGLGALAVRARRGTVEQADLVSALTIALLAGWLGSRLATGVYKHGLQGIAVGEFLPTEHVPQSFSIFSAVALPVLLLELWRRRMPLLACLDLLAPSACVAIAVAKVGCLLAGCCAGAECPASWGIRYPYASRPYAMQVAELRVQPPAALVKSEEDGAASLFGHLDSLRAVRGAPPEELVRHAARYGLTYAQWVQLAEKERSNPVWPVPLFYVVAALLLWIAAEVVYRRSTRAGCTLALVLIAYAAMRFCFDPLLAQPGPLILGLPMAQLVALVPLIAGAIIAALCLRKKSLA